MLSCAIAILYNKNGNVAKQASAAVLAYMASYMYVHYMLPTYLVTARRRDLKLCAVSCNKLFDITS